MLWPPTVQWLGQNSGYRYRGDFKTKSACANPGSQYQYLVAKRRKIADLETIQ